MERTIYSDIIEGNIPSYKIFEDDSFYAFLDIFPRAKGHTLVIPKKQYRWVYDVPEFGAYWEVVHKITRAMQKGLQPVWVNYTTLGLQVAHAHIHILPRYTPETEIVETFPEEILKFTKEEFEEIAEKIRSGF